MLEKLSKVEKSLLKLIILTSTLDIVLFKAIAVLSKGFQIQTTTFGFACTKIVGKLSMLVILVLMGKLVAR